MPWPGCVSIGHDPEGLAWHQQDERMHLPAWQPLAAGFLAREINSNDPDHVSQCFITAANIQRKKLLSEIAEKVGVSLAQIAMKWVTQQARCHAIIGTKSIINWQSAQQAMAISSADLEAL